MNSLAKIDSPIVLRKPAGSVALPDNDQWTNRFEIKSESSNRVYIVAQNKKKKHFGCSCPGYKRHRTCKHLKTIGLPTNELPFTGKLQ
jgi:hypothetical protein